VSVPSLESKRFGHRQRCLIDSTKRRQQHVKSSKVAQTLRAAPQRVIHTVAMVARANISPNSTMHARQSSVSRRVVTSRLDTIRYLAHAYRHRERKVVTRRRRRVETCRACRTARRVTLVTTSATGVTRTALTCSRASPQRGLG